VTEPSLFGWPSEAATAAAAGIEVVGVPSDCGNGIASGARYGPAAIRAASLDVFPPASGIDHGDVGEVHRCDWEDVLTRVEQVVSAIVRRGACPVVLGGDHAISYAAVAALRDRRPLNIIWFDAHTDFCAWQGGNWHDHKQVLRRIASLDHVGRIVQVGHRGITYFDEVRSLDRLTVITAGEAQRCDAAALLAHLPVDEPIYMSIDIDAVDPQAAPGTGHPVPAGLRVARLCHLARCAASSRETAGLDLMEVNPLLDHRNMTSNAAARILAEILPTLKPTAGTSAIGWPQAAAQR